MAGKAPSKERRIPLKDNRAPSSDIRNPPREHGAPLTDSKAPSQGRSLPHLSLAEAHRKAESYVLGNLHRQSNAAAKQAILQELHSSMQLTAEKIRLQRRRGQEESPHDGDADYPSLQRRRGQEGSPHAGYADYPSHGASEIDTTRHTPGHPHPHPTLHPSGNFPMHVTFSGTNFDQKTTPAKTKSRIPVPVQQAEYSRQRPDGQLVTGGQGSKVQAGRGKATPKRHAVEAIRGKDGGKEEHDILLYTWDQRGRINELRIRCIARRFFAQWQTNALTGIKPSVVRMHYNSGLLRKMFGEWREYWWTQRREWTLLIRAEYHHRYKMYQWVWQAWRAFVLRERVKSAKREIAQAHASRIVLMRVIEAWKEYVSQRRAKTLLCERALRFRERAMLQLHWDTWTAAIHRHRQLGEAETFALQYWADTTTQKAWEAWRRMFRDRQEMKSRKRQAQGVYERSLVAKCYQGLLQYTLDRREKKQRKDYASHVFKSGLLVQAWQHWHQRWFTRRSLALRQEQVDRHGNRARMHRALIHWRFYIDLLQRERLKEDKARRHHNTQLMKCSLLSLKLAVVQRRVKVRRTRQAEEHYEELLVKHCWNQWMLQCEHSEELRLFSATRKARLMHRRRLLGSVMQRWCDYTQWCQHRKAQYLRAEVHYTLRVVPMCLHRLRLNVELEKRKRELVGQASQFYRESLLARHFVQWWHCYQTSQDDRMMDRMAFLHHESVVARRFFSEWRHRTRAKLREEEKLDVAIDHHHTAVCARAMSRWREFVRESKQRCEYERLAALHCYLGSLKKAFSVWREYIVHRRCKSVEKRKADSHYGRRQKRRVFTAWQVHCRELKQVYGIVAVKESRANHRRLQNAFSDWKEYTDMTREERRLHVQAVSHYNITLTHKVVIAWRVWAQDHATDTAMSAWRVEQVHTKLNAAKLRSAFLTWRDRAQSAAEETRKDRKAADFHEWKLKERSLHTWQRFRVHHLKKQLLTRQAMWLNKIRIQSKLFSMWKQQFAAAQEENRQTVLALWLWSMRLQQRALRAWVCYVREKQRKKARITEALEQRRRELLKEGVRQWLGVASCLAERRTSIAAKHHAQSSYKSYQVVQRCASHWRQKTLANRGKQRPPAKPTSRRRVTFEDQVKSRDQSSRVTSSFPAQMSGMVPQPPVSSLLPVLSVSAEERLGPGVVSVSAEERLAPGSETRLPAQGMVRPVVSKGRPQPRRPDFLRDSLKREGLWGQSPSKGHRNNEMKHQVEIPQLITSTTSTLDPPPSHAHPSTQKLIEPGPTRQPIAESEHAMKDDPLPLMGEEASAERNTPDPRQWNVPLQSMGGNSLCDDNEEERSDGDVTDFAMVTNGEGDGHQENVSSDQISDSKGLGKVSSDFSTKSTILLPPSAFMSNACEAKKGKQQPKSEREGKSHDSTRVLALQTQTHSPSGITELHPPPSRMRSHTPSGSRVAGSVREDTEEVYSEIQKLKKTLQGFKDKKSRLKELQRQENELHGWLKELNVTSSEDSAGLLIGDELVQVQEEISSLMEQVQESKPQIKGLLARISQLAQHTAGY